MRARWCVVLLLATACRCGGRDGGSTYAPELRVRPRIELPALDPAKVEPVATIPPALERVRILPTVVHGPRQEDRFTQDPALVDVLWVVDNSGTLANERERLVLQLDRFLRTLLEGNVDFHVGVTSTDLASSVADGGRLRGVPAWIDRSTPDPREVFRRAVDFPLDLQVRLEEGLAATVLALSPPLTAGANRGFLRDEAALAVIVVSDEDDGSLGDPAQYTRFLRSLKGPGREVNVSLSAVVGPRPDGCVNPGEERIFGARAKAGDRYIEVAEATRGLVESVCTPNFGPFVDALATALSNPRRFFPLSAPPDPDTILVWVDGVRAPEGSWTYDETRRGISFDGTYAPPPGAEIRIEYDVAS